MAKKDSINELELFSRKGLLKDTGYMRGNTWYVMDELASANPEEVFMVVKVSDLTLGKQIKRARLMQDMKAIELSKVFEISPATLSHLERGATESTNPYRHLNFINFDYKTGGGIKNG